MSDLQKLLRGHVAELKNKKAPTKVAGDRNLRHLVLDSATGDPVLDAAGEFEHMATRMDAVAAIQQWIEEDDYDEGESSADRLMAMIVGIADDNQDGDLDDDEMDVVDAAREAAWDYLESIGIENDDIDALLNDWDEAAAERIRDAVASAIPDGDAALESIDDFTFDDAEGDDEEDDEEGTIFDATYRKRLVVRGGKKMRVNKRVAGRVRLTGKQKLAIKKARRKAQSPRAKARRLKSMKIRRRMGM